MKKILIASLILFSSVCKGQIYKVDSTYKIGDTTSFGIAIKVNPDPFITFQVNLTDSINEVAYITKDTLHIVDSLALIKVLLKTILDEKTYDSLKYPAKEIIPFANFYVANTNTLLFDTTKPKSNHYYWLWSCNHNGVNAWGENDAIFNHYPSRNEIIKKYVPVEKGWVKSKIEVDIQQVTPDQLNEILSPSKLEQKQMQGYYRSIYQH